MSFEPLPFGEDQAASEPKVPQSQVPHPLAAEGCPVRSPTVTLSADNVRRLQGYPRPPRDNGIGLHFHLDLRDHFIAETVANLKSIRATWTCIYAQDELQTERAATACFAAGIMPVVRIGRQIDEPVEPAQFVHGLRRAWQAAGWGRTPEPLYVQLYNEPEDLREWVGGVMPRDWARRFGETWAREAPKIVDAGGYVGIQVLDRFGFDEAVDAVARNGQQHIWDRAFFVHHNYGQNHPPAYPYDAIKQVERPGITILDDHVAALKFLAHAAWMQDRLGFVLPVIGGEGGWWLYNDEDKHYPKVEWPLHAQYHKEMYEWLRTGVLSNGEPTPDYLFSITSWITGSWTFAAQNWWGNSLSPTGKLDQTIAAMQSIPEFVRRFSWDGAPAPVDAEPGHGPDLPGNGDAGPGPTLPDVGETGPGPLLPGVWGRTVFGLRTSQRTRSRLWVSSKDEGAGMVPADLGLPVGCIPVGKAAIELELQATAEALLPSLKPELKQAIFTRPRSGPAVTAGWLRQEFSGYLRADQEGQPGGQGHADQQALHVLEVRNLTMLPVPAVRLVVSKGAFDWITPTVQANQVPLR